MHVSLLIYIKLNRFVLLILNINYIC
ncbi:hypothetical protein NSMM_360036 [Nitrosomonas mobilis]|uniref:Uncharacterized protein n=1 Tax=Nitrosomonas mobilis TaxID=51642 RepID=A0A1G5SF94_9PROT|nr:hypothetical protein NSMM_360036 [Nitrosomonas mobilis]